jgi:hypothetical protein
MKPSGMIVWALGTIAVLSPYFRAQTVNQSARMLTLRSPDALELHSVKADSVSYRGRSAVRITDAAGDAGDDVSRIAIVKGTSVQDGSVEVDLSGDTAPDTPANLRGFVGIAFRVGTGGAHYECIYLRPKNGRSEDQLQRNHSAQYISVPDFPWQKLRNDSPGKYESYVDLVPGAWTKVKIQFSGTNARLYVNGSEQPVLIVHDLKLPAEAGAVALWVGPGTIAYFSGLSLSR